MSKLDTAFVLVGGKGTRLRPLTNNIPKALIPLGGRTLLEHILLNLKKQNVTNILLSVGYLADKIENHFGDGSNLGINIKYVREDEPLGTGGPLKLAAEHLNDTFLMLNGDVLSNIDVREMHKTHGSNGTSGTIALVPVEDPSRFGVAEVDGNKITQFIEKPKKEDAPSNLINAGMYILEPGVVSELPGGFSMVEKDLFPKLANQGMLSHFKYDGQWFDLGTFESYSQAQAEWTQNPLPDITEKPWGREVLLAHTNNYAAKLLEVKKGHRLSFQYHEKKHETLYLETGKIKFTLGDETFDLTPGKHVEVPPKTRHRMESLEDSRFFEVSTSELYDVVRLEDDYGRTNE